MLHRILLTTLLAASASAFAQDIDYVPVAIDDPAIAAAIHDLGARALAAPDAADDPIARLANRAALELGAGRYVDAAASIARARELREKDGTPPMPASVGMEVYARAKAREAEHRESFGEAYAHAFAVVLATIDDRVAYDVEFFLGRLPRFYRTDLERTLERYANASSVTLPQAVEIVRGYAWWQASEQFFRELPAVAARENQRRYIVEDGVPVQMPDGATISAIVVRPRSAAPLPALLQFTIYASPVFMDEARETASRGYVGVIGYSRGKYKSAGPIVPWEHDGADARALIEWIARQPWSDGRVGMYGGSYNAFVQWSAAKNPPAALKAMMPPAAGEPGVAGPMEGNIFLTYQYRWVPYTTSGSMLDEEGYNDAEHWRALDKAWYVSGRPYREMDRIDGKPNPLYRRHLDHPSYDEYWQRLTPQGAEFANIDIPVLAVTGYYDGGQVGALHYFTEHLKHNPNADHTLVIGPYTHGGAQHRSEPFVRGYAIDRAAALDVHALRYAWFDYVLKGAPRPALLKDRVNYQVMGANVWRHAPSLDAMAPETLRLHLVPGAAGAATHALARHADPDAFVDLEIDLADRSDVDWLPPYANVLASLDTHNALAFVSAPLPRDTELSGMVEGTLDFTINKKDMDFVVRLYELSAEGEYLELSQMYVQRASYVRHRTTRELLVPGERQRLEFTKPGPISRLAKAGSQLVVYLGIQKQRDAQVNYGTGKDVSDESIADAGEPLRVRWHGTSFVDFGVAPER